MLPEPLHAWTEEEVRKEFEHMTRPEKLYYRDLVADLKPEESRPLHAAALAVESIQRKRRYEGTKHVLDPEKRTLGNLDGRAVPWRKNPVYWPKAYRQRRAS